MRMRANTEMSKHEAYPMMDDLPDDLFHTTAHSVEDPVVRTLLSSPSFWAIACCAGRKGAVDVAAEFLLGVLHDAVRHSFVRWITWQ